MNIVPWVGKGLKKNIFFPSIDISEDRNVYFVRAEMPGIDKKDIKVSVHNNILTIKGEKKQSREVKGKDTYYEETRYGSFYRQMPLGSEVTGKGVKADFRNGILTLMLPKKRSGQTKPLSISIK